MHKKSFLPAVIYFFLGEYFSDAIRNTITIVLPIAVFFYMGRPELATGIGIGALLISLTDFPDNKINKFKTAFYGIILFFLTTVVVSLSLTNGYLLGAVLIAAAFGFSMLAAYGNRMAVLGVMGIVVCTFVMGLQPKNPLYFSLYLLIGGVWYYLNSLLQIVIFPYRSFHHAIFECLISSAEFLKSKAKNYDLLEEFDASQKQIIKLHIRVNSKHELIRNLLLTDTRAMAPGNEKGNILFGRALLLIDLYEQLNAVHYDYGLVRKTLANADILPSMKAMIDLMAQELNALAGELRFGKRSDEAKSFDQAYGLLSVELLIKLKELNRAQADIVMAFHRNTEDVVGIISKLRKHEIPDNIAKGAEEQKYDYTSFLSIDGLGLLKNLSLKSPIFRFSLRLAICFLFGFLVIFTFDLSRYSYWLFLTIVFVARPKFTVTWQRNLHRITGSMIGIILGLALLYFIKSPTVLFSLSVIFLLLFFSFNRLNYGVSVVFITLAVIITLGSYHGNIDVVIQDRILYTVLGCLIAVVASYLFPIWDSSQLDNRMREAITSTSTYLAEVHVVSINSLNDNQLRMARKNANLSLSRLSEALDSASQEPYKSTLRLNDFYKIQVLLYRINALITSVYLADERLDPTLMKDVIKNLSLYDLDNSTSTTENDFSNEAVSLVNDKMDQIVNLSKALKNRVATR